MESSRSKLNPVRGVFAAVVGALVGGVAPIVVLAAGTVIRWWITGASEFDRRYDIGWVRNALPGPVVGCATICAARRATFAPRGRYRFARSLAVITAISLGVWLVVGSMELTPRRLKGIEHPMFYPSEWMLLMGPPIAAAVMMTVFRLRAAAPRSGSDAAPMTAPAGDRDRPDRQIRPV